MTIHNIFIVAFILLSALTPLVHLIGSPYNSWASQEKPVTGSTFVLFCHLPSASGLTVNWLKKNDISSESSVIATANSKRCHAAIDPRYTWFGCSPPSISSPTEHFNLLVTNAQPYDSGYWSCQDIGLSAQTTSIKVLVVQARPGTPQITGFPSEPVTAGTQVNLKCVASPTGDTYDWYKYGTKAITSSRYDFKVTKKSAGVYKCVVGNAAGSTTSSGMTMVVYYKPDSVVVSSGKTSSHVGGKDKFTCIVTGGNPTPTLKIYFKRSGGTPVEVTHGQDRVMGKEDNQGVYYCEAKVPGYPALDMTSSRKTYNVTYPPTAKLSSSPSTVKEGDTVTLACEASRGNPTVYTYIWYYNNKPIPSVNSRDYRIPSIRHDKSGEYRCRVVNYYPGGIADASMTIDVFYKAKWNPKQLKTLTVASKPNAPVRFTLHIIANPRPTNVIWFHPNHKTATDENFIPAEVNGTYTLSKGSVGSPDYGNYTVKVTNSVGSSSFVFELRRTAPSVPTFTITRNGKVVTVAFGPLIKEYTRFQLLSCEPGQAPTTTGCSGAFFPIGDPRKTKYTIYVTNETTIYDFYLELYDGDDVVYSAAHGPVQPYYTEQNTTIPTGSGSKLGIKVGVVVAVIIMIAVVVVVVVELHVHRRNLVCFSGRKKPEGSNHGDERTDSMRPEAVFQEPIYININRAFEGEPGGEQTSDEDTQQEKRVQEVVYDDTELRDGPSGENAARKVEGGDENPYDEIENPYANLNITPDVIASQTYAELKPWTLRQAFHSTKEFEKS